MNVPQNLELFDNLVLEAIDEVFENSQSKSKADKTAELFQCLWMDFFNDTSNYSIHWNFDKSTKFLKQNFSKIWNSLENGYWWEINEDLITLTQYYPYLFKGIPSMFNLLKNLKSIDHKILLLKFIQVLCANQLKMIITYEPDLMKFQINTIDDWIYLLSKARFWNWKSTLDLSKIQKLFNSQNYIDMIFEIVQVSYELDVFYNFSVNENCPIRKKSIDPRCYIPVFCVMIYLCCVEYSKSLK